MHLRPIIVSRMRYQRRRLPFGVLRFGEEVALPGVPNDPARHGPVVQRQEQGVQPREVGGVREGLQSQRCLQSLAKEACWYLLAPDSVSAAPAPLRLSFCQQVLKGMDQKKLLQFFRTNVRCKGIEPMLQSLSLSGAEHGCLWQAGSGASRHRNLAQNLVHSSQGRFTVERGSGASPVSTSSTVQILQQRTRTGEARHGLLSRLDIRLNTRHYRSSSATDSIAKGCGQVVLKAGQGYLVLLLLSFATRRSLDLLRETMEEQRNIVVGLVDRAHHALVQPVFDDSWCTLFGGRCIRHLHSLRRLQPSLVSHSRCSFLGDDVKHCCQDSLAGRCLRWRRLLHALWLALEGQRMTVENGADSAVGDIC
mmetsp:Transcript_8324/g.19591  ORF Transcript_8324/g.19591 Transcript_8324/m.19591 type:complete len:365 (+) Transcript_8324:3787-4881(+)